MAAGLDFAEVANNGVASLASTAMATAGGGYAEGVPTFMEDLPVDAPPADQADLDAEELDTEVEGTAPTFDELMSEPAAESEELSFSEATDEDSPFALEDSTADGSTATAPLPSEDFGEDNGMPGISAASSAARRRKREPSFIGNLIGVVGGGVVGCTMAYFIVLWIGGPDKDFLELGPKLPSWMLPAAFNETTTAKSSFDKPAGPVTPMSANPTPEELDEVKQAGGGDEETMKLNVPPLDESAEAPPQVKLPFAADDEAADTDPSDELLDSAEDLAGDLAADIPIVAPTLPTGATAGGEDSAAVDPASGDGSADVATDEEMLDEPADPFGVEPAKTTPADDAAGQGAAGDDALGDDLASDQDTVDTSAEVGPKELPQYTAADLQTALADVETMHQALSAVKESDKAARNIKRQFYRKVYRLGEVATFATGADEAMQGAAESLAVMAADSSRFSEIGKAGISWMKLDPEKREDDKGVLLAGAIKEIGKAGTLYRLVLVPAGAETNVVVLSPNALAMAPGDTVLVLGSIITNPRESLHNYTGDDETVVWHGLSVKAGQ